MRRGPSGVRRCAQEHTKESTTRACASQEPASARKTPVGAQYGRRITVAWVNADGTETWCAGSGSGSRARARALGLGPEPELCTACRERLPAEHEEFKLAEGLCSRMPLSRIESDLCSPRPWPSCTRWK